MNQRPNIIFVLTDDQGAWALGCAGNPEVQTPRIDALARQGIRFDDFFCTSPVCSPARASLLTGRMPSAHGVHDWIRRGNLVSPKGLPVFAGDDCVIEYLRGMRAYTETLAEAGYRCGISGKWHMGDSL
jgi:choline-sulfatase